MTLADSRSQMWYRRCKYFKCRLNCKLNLNTYLTGMWNLNSLQGNVANFSQIYQEAEPGLELEEWLQARIIPGLLEVLCFLFSKANWGIPAQSLCFWPGYSIQRTSICSLEASSPSPSLDRYTVLQKHREFARKISTFGGIGLKCHRLSLCCLL